MKDSKLKEEVQAAVREYLSSLIQERKQPGKGGMAVTTHDLMVAAKSAGKSSKTHAHYRFTRIHILAPTTRSLLNFI